MSGAGRRRPARTRRAHPRPARPALRLGSRATAALTAVTLGAAVAVPAAMVPGAPAGEQAVRGAAAGAAAPLRAAPTDQIRSREWHLDALRAQKAWRYSRGRGVTVAVLDTGVDRRHPDLTGHVINGPDLTGGLRKPGSRYWGLHGTSMASIISGHGHGPGLTQGMMGVAPLSRVLSIRVTLENDDPLRRDNGQQAGTGDRDAVAQGIRYAVDHGAEIINMSLGGGRQSYNGTPSQEKAIRYALGKGVVLIASAGNDGSGANRRNFPAAYPGVIAVGALDRRLRLWKDSNRRSNAAVCAPGVEIVSADASNGYVVGTGTSASSAMVAGVAALVRARYPRLSPDEVRRALIQGSPARAGRPTGSATCRGTVDAVRTLVAANEINKTSSGPVETPPPAAATPEPAAASPVRDSGVLLPLVLGGGGLLIVLGLVLGWRQRRRPEEDTGDTDAVADYGLPSAPREPASAVPSGAYTPAAPRPAPAVAPVNAPLFQNNEVYPGPAFGEDAPSPEAWEAPQPAPSPLDVPLWDAPADPAPAPADPALADLDPGGSQEPPSSIEPERPPVMPGELRPFDPGEFAVNGGNGNGNGTLNGHDVLNGNGHNGNGNGDGGAALNGAGLNGSPARGEPSPLDDDDWESFRRGAVDIPDVPEGGTTAPLSAVSPEPADEPPPPPVLPADEPSTGAFPAVPPPGAADHGPPDGPVPPPDQAGDEPRGRHSRGPHPADDEDYRPPWW
ncbi:S8 family serine peptidase [Actinomadura madurae]|uniref:S8 family peptidase n=1 Tax=Actinomadura madurae TaxID=1993 RepID=UPI002026A919|nr:S8 family serine peptidase [Actinomadura madurae]URM98677.1 S8 family serine peptidase [Actinomadura madurae]